jgi:poly-gamma-glutamate capsule biosynthesis protein CapA/YwtB (metallophosphatase superfamily)
MLGRGVNPQSDSLAALEPDLSRADLALANLESPLAPVLTGADSPYNLCTLSSNAQMLDDWGFDLLSIANNHSLDCGPGGLGETHFALQSVGITPIDPGLVPVFREVHGQKLAFLSFDDISSTIDTISAVKSIQSAKQAGAMVVVSIHWGAEYQGGASDRQKSLAAQFAEAGASLIWGHHPHVLQPASWIETSQGKTLVLFSLGNALFDQDGMEDTRQSAMVLVSLNTNGITSVRSFPFLIDIGDSRVVLPDPENAVKIKDRINIP